MNRRLLIVLGVALTVVALLLSGLGVALAQTPPSGPGWGASGGMMPGGMMPGGIMGGGMMGGGMTPGGMTPGGMMPGGRHPGMAGDAARWFIEAMIPHHEDAVAMADLALAQAEHQELRDLAATIKRAQTDEVDQMRQWYRDWYGAEPRPGVMQGHMRGGMGDPAALDGARPFDRAFIEQMIPHHQMAVMMATMALPSVEQPELRGLLQSIITSQSAEIAQMSQWHRDWYGASPPAMGPGMMGGGMMGGAGAGMPCAVAPR
jgi:uncharacterized protein (DUF305 family)